VDATIILAQDKDRRTGSTTARAPLARRAGNRFRGTLEPDVRFRRDEMKIGPKTVLLAYFDRWWLPAVTCAALVFIYVLAQVARWWIAKTTFSRLLYVVLLGGLRACVGLSLLMLLAAAVWNLVQKRWAKSILNLAMIFVCGLLALHAYGFLLLVAIFAPDEDHFSDNLVIPNDIAITEPASYLYAEPGDSQDAFQRSLVDALKRPGGDDASVTADIPSLVRIEEKNPQILRRYLETSPAWRVFKEEGAVFAARRWMIGSTWNTRFVGFFTNRDIDPKWSSGLFGGASSGSDAETDSPAVIPKFRTRCSIGLSGKPWMADLTFTTHLRVGETKQVVPDQKRPTERCSHCVMGTGDLVLEIFDESDSNERRLTNAALVELNEEFRPLAESPTWETIEACLPTGSIQHGADSLDLLKRGTDGYYVSETWLNPGEPGMIYLKAFEATQGTPLSVDRIKLTTSEWIGWSDDPAQQFFSSSDFTIYEGDHDKPYAARVEVWFVPDSRGQERKLIEKVFRVEGFQGH
jgi:hypothetical protein